MPARLLPTYVRNYFNDQGCILLSEYHNATELLDYICVCGSTSRISFHNFQRGHRCQNCRRERMTGSTGWRWNSSLTDKERSRRQYHSDNWICMAWRNKVYDRDYFTCQCCGASNVPLNAHHIINWDDSHNLRFDIDNGITMCKECHKEFHKLYGRKHNSPEQLMEFFYRKAV